VSGDRKYANKLHYTLEAPGSTETVMIGGRPYELLLYPKLQEWLARNHKTFLIDLDKHPAHQPPGGLRCYKCLSTNLTSVKMSHQLSDRVGIIQCIEAQGTSSSISGKVRECGDCKAILYDWDGRMLVQMSEMVQQMCPASPCMAYGKVHVSRSLERSLNIDPIKAQGGETIHGARLELGALDHDEAGSAYEQTCHMYLAQLYSIVGDDTWEKLDDQSRLDLAERRAVFIELKSEPLDSWPPWSTCRYDLSAETLRGRREMLFESRREFSRRAILSVLPKRGSDDVTFHAAKKLGKKGLHVCGSEIGEIAAIALIPSTGSWKDREPQITEVSSREGVRGSLVAWYTDDCPKNKPEIEEATGAPNRGDKAHTLRRSLGFANHFASLWSRISHLTKMAFSKPRENSVRLIDSLLLKGMFKITLGDRTSSGQGRDADKFTLEEIAIAKEVIFNEITGTKTGAGICR
jgi:hypothetical protein